jgi:hypothetical protein
MSNKAHSYHLKVPKPLWKKVEEYKEKTGQSYRDLILAAVREKLDQNKPTRAKPMSSIPVGDLPESRFFEAAAGLDMNRQETTRLAAELRAARLRGEEFPLASRAQAVVEREEQLVEQMEEIMAQIAKTP